MPALTLENYIGLVNGTGFSSSFFAKELNLPFPIVEFVNFLSKIKYAKNKDARLKILD